MNARPDDPQRRRLLRANVALALKRADLGEAARAAISALL